MTIYGQVTVKVTATALSQKLSSCKIIQLLDE